MKTKPKKPAFIVQARVDKTRIESPVRAVPPREPKKEENQPKQQLFLWKKDIDGKLDASHLTAAEEIKEVTNKADEREVASKDIISCEEKKGKATKDSDGELRGGQKSVKMSSDLDKDDILGR